jgi:hypothetical protein
LLALGVDGKLLKMAASSGMTFLRLEERGSEVSPPSRYKVSGSEKHVQLSIPLRTLKSNEYEILKDFIW